MHFDPREQWASTEEGRNKLVGALMSTSVGSADNMGVSDPRDLPRRHLHLEIFLTCTVYMLLNVMLQTNRLLLQQHSSGFYVHQGGKTRFDSVARPHMPSA